MTQVIIQPAANTASRENFDLTAKNSVPLNRIREAFPEDRRQRLDNLYPEGVVSLWGVRPGATSSKQDKWKKIKPGDVVLFTGGGEIYASSTVTLKIQSKEVATDLWGTDDSGKTWEFIYLLADTAIEQHIPYKDFNRVVGYKENYSPQGFMVLDLDKSRAALEAFDFDVPEIAGDEERKQEIEKVIDAIDRLEKSNESLNVRQDGYRRLEQHILRNHLFEHVQSADCVLCGKSIPTGLLVAAHIKKRSKCNRDEMLDYQNNVAPICKLGCDELFERGYLAVDDGQVIARKQSELTPAVREYISGVAGRDCTFWHEGSKPYFDYHRNSIES